MRYPEVAIRKDWRETPPPQKTQNQLLQLDLDDQHSMYKEICAMIEEKGIIRIDKYVNFLLEELLDGPYWEEILKKYVIEDIKMEDMENAENTEDMENAENMDADA